MSKFRIKLSLQGLNLEIEGSRDDVPLIAHALTQQIGGLLQPSASIVEGEVVDVSLNNAATNPAPSEQSPRKRSRVSRPKSVGDSAKATPEVVDWKHDPSKYGSPNQSWSIPEKAKWVLYVVSQAAGTSDLSGRSIAATFNKHFRQSGQIKTGHVNRDLGRLKSARGIEPAHVSEDTTKTPPAWFLTEAGIKDAQRLITQSLGKSE